MPEADMDFLATNGYISLMQKENLEAHAVLTERLARVETKMPNGQLDKVLSMLQTLTDRR